MSRLSAADITRGIKKREADMARMKNSIEGIESEVEALRTYFTDMDERVKRESIKANADQANKVRDWMNIDFDRIVRRLYVHYVKDSKDKDEANARISQLHPAYKNFSELTEEEEAEAFEDIADVEQQVKEDLESTVAQVQLRADAVVSLGGNMTTSFHQIAEKEHALMQHEKNLEAAKEELKAKREEYEEFVADNPLTSAPTKSELDEAAIEDLLDKDGDPNEIIELISTGLAYQSFSTVAFRKIVTEKAINNSSIMMILTTLATIGNNPNRLTNTNRVKDDRTAKSVLKALRKIGTFTKSTNDRTGFTLARFGIAYAPAYYMLRLKLQGEGKLQNQFAPTPEALQDPAMGVLAVAMSKEPEFRSFEKAFGAAVASKVTNTRSSTTDWLKVAVNGMNQDPRARKELEMVKVLKVATGEEISLCITRLNKEADATDAATPPLIMATQKELTTKA